MPLSSPLNHLLNHLFKPLIHLPSPALPPSLLPLAPLSTPLHHHIALTGPPTTLLSTILLSLTLTPSAHNSLPHDSGTTLNEGEYPAVGALTSGYVFRVENVAVVWWLKRVGVTGGLIDVEVRSADGGKEGGGGGGGGGGGDGGDGSLLVGGLGALPSLMTALALLVMIRLEDWQGFVVLGMFVLARVLGTVVLVKRARDAAAWHGAKEPGAKGDLLVLLSQDRWVRVRGLVDDLKMVTSGAWVRDARGGFEEWALGGGTVVWYVAAGLAVEVGDEGKWVLICLFLLSTVVISVRNSVVEEMVMKGRVLSVVGRRSYGRRLDMAAELLEEKTGYTDTMRSAMLRLGMLVPDKDPRGNRDGPMGPATI